MSPMKPTMLETARNGEKKTLFIDIRCEPATARERRRRRRLGITRARFYVLVGAFAHSHAPAELFRQSFRLVLGQDKDAVEPRDFQQAFYTRLKMRQEQPAARLAKLLQRL